MRTLTELSEQLLAQAGIGTSAERAYHVEGHIVFHGYSPGTLEMRAAILEEDSRAPWVDAHAHPESDRRSIKYLSEGPTVQEYSKNNPKQYWYMIVPGIDFLRRHQVYAYQRYLEALARSLARRQIPGVVGVRAVVKTSYCSEIFTAI